MRKDSKRRADKRPVGIAASMLCAALAALAAAVLVGLGGPRPVVHHRVVHRSASTALQVDTTAAFLDTVAVYGPKRFEAAGGRPQLHIEEFATEALPGHPLHARGTERRGGRKRADLAGHHSAERP